VYASVPQREQEIERQLQIAQESQKNKDYNRSALAYQEILRLRPDWALIHQSLGVVYHLQSKYKEAIASFNNALRLDPKLWGSYLFLGMDLYRTNQFSKAVPALEQAIQINPEMSESEARFWLGSSFLALEQYREAILQFQRLVALKPRDLESLFSLAQAYSRFSSALFKEIGKINQESAEAHRLQGEWFESQNKLDRAIGEYLQVTALRPDWEGVHQDISRLYVSQGQLNKAVRELEQELRLTPGNDAVRRELEALKDRSRQSSAGLAEGLDSGHSLEARDSSTASSIVKQPEGSASLGIEKFRDQDFKSAKALLSQAIRENSDSPTALIYLARSHYALGEVEQAIQLLENQSQSSGRSLETLYWLGKSYQELAASALQKMVDIDPASYRVNQMSGELLEEKTKYAEALKAYQTALKQSPDLAGIRYAIGNVYWKMQELDEALTWLKQELERNPYHALANYKIGNIYVLKGSSDSAIPYFEQAIEANPGMLVAQQELAKVFISQGRFEDAIARLKIVVAATPEDESPHYLLSTAYKKLGKNEEANAELKLFGQLMKKKADGDKRYLEKRILVDGETSQNQKQNASTPPLSSR
jgi:tetratricopeptide (TPR) repeat protein